MINNSRTSSNMKNEIVFTSATSEPIPNIIRNVKPIIDNNDILITTLCCLILFDNFCIMILFFVIENVYFYFCHCEHN